MKQDVPKTKRMSRQRREARRLFVMLGTGLAVMALLATAGLLLLGGDADPPRKVPEIQTVWIVPPPPPPPPPPPQQQQEQQQTNEPKMIEQQPVKEEAKPEPKQDKPSESANQSDEPPGVEGLSAGPGPGLRGGRGGGRAGGGGTRWGWYATIVQTQIEAALRSHPKTRNAEFQVQMRLWADTSGRVTRVQFMKSSGDAGMDAVLRDEILAGLVLREPPPKDMPMPIVTRVTERKAS
jgi:type IV secretory pathway VirB10-like protein